MSEFLSTQPTRRMHGVLIYAAVAAILLRQFDVIDNLGPVAISRTIMLALVLLLATKRLPLLAGVRSVAVVLPLCAASIVVAPPGESMPRVYAILQILLVFTLAVQLVAHYGMERFLQHYQRAAIFVAIIGYSVVVVQIAGWDPYALLAAGGLSENTTYSAGLPRFRSLLSEPAHYVVFVAPALVLPMYRLASGKIDVTDAALILSAILTFSLSGYAVVAAVLVHVLYRTRRLSLPIAFMVGACGIAPLAMFGDALSLRLDALRGMDWYDAGQNASNVGALVANWQVAQENLMDHPWLGVGLTGHEDSYYEYFGSVFSGFGLNARDAASLYIRAISELGILGCVYAGLVLLVSSVGRRWRVSANQTFLVAFAAVGLRYGSLDQLQPWLLLALAVVPRPSKRLRGQAMIGSGRGRMDDRTNVLAYGR